MKYILLLLFTTSLMAEPNIIPNSGALPLSGGQISFPATANVSANVNTIDDYEEGSWTPTITGSPSYVTQVGYYTKIGNLVFVQGRLDVTGMGAAGTITIGGLPFEPIIVGTNSYGAGIFGGDWSGLISQLNMSSLRLRVNGGKVLQLVIDNGSGASAYAVHGTNMSANAKFNFNMTYFTAE